MLRLVLGILLLGLSGCFLWVNTPPIAVLQLTTSSGESPLSVTFSGNGSSDSDGTIVQYQWDFGDGWTAQGASTSHTYTAPGIYLATLTVTDDDGEQASAQASIVVTASQTIDLEFQWRSHATDWTWEVAVPTAHYATFQAITTRPWCQDYGPCDWYKYVTDPRDDEFIESLTDTMLNAISPYYADSLSTYYGFLQFVLDFVTDVIPYTLDSRPDEWPRYPLETLVEGIGDCEDTAILFASIVRPVAQSVHLLFFPAHVAAGVPVDWEFVNSAPYPVGYYQYAGQVYVIVETTGDPPTMWQIGELPAGLEAEWQSGQVWFYDVGENTLLTSQARVHRPTSQDK